jgi:hypothetical protein
MSIYAIQNYHKELEKIINYGGSKKETAIHNAFYYLLNEYARSKELMLIASLVFIGILYGALVYVM